MGQFEIVRIVIDEAGEDVRLRRECHLCLDPYRRSFCLCLSETRVQLLLRLRSLRLINRALQTWES